MIFLILTLAALLFLIVRVMKRELTSGQSSDVSVSASSPPPPIADPKATPTFTPTSTPQVPSGPRRGGTGKFVLRFLSVLALLGLFLFLLLMTVIFSTVPMVLS